MSCEPLACDCCHCDNEPLGILISLEDLFEVSIPFEDGVSDYEDTIEQAGDYDETVIVDERCSVREVRAFVCGYSEKVFFSRTRIDGIFGYMHVVETFVIAYSFNYHASSHTISGTVTVTDYLTLYVLPDISPEASTSVILHIYNYVTRSSVIGNNCEFLPVNSTLEYTNDDSLTDIPGHYEAGDRWCCQVEEFPQFDPPVIIVDISVTDQPPVDMDAAEIISPGGSPLWSGNPHSFGFLTLTFNSCVCVETIKSGLLNAAWAGYDHELVCVSSDVDNPYEFPFASPPLSRVDVPLTIRAYYAD